MMEICAFDFDGTLTRSDTLLGMIRHHRGMAGLLGVLLWHSPLLLLMKVGLYSNGKVKRKVFDMCFGGMAVADFDNLCREYAAKHHGILRTNGMRCIDNALRRGSKVVIVSASIENWVRPFFHGYESIEIVGTKIETEDGKLTGRFITENCYGGEKVARLLELYPDRKAYRLVAYGDSRGDRELLAFADERHYKEFDKQG
ncbi:HAD family hydrolase [Prevotella sp. OH937_COT-195]|uniref:HAD family hydrolase n=1 Tax=Prevotella sp. OH937_COT-195 TaxID=2491051 RepID=UPI000F64BF11|nr:HAD family hydrolase [Prevotella sp. OH937_COT-195]RRD02518.1 haloacid dehalogenase-like hydrolase [Prevotella sp. OH937_COT-195]